MNIKARILAFRVAAIGRIDNISESLPWKRSTGDGRIPASARITMSRFLVVANVIALHEPGELFTGMSSDKSTPGYRAECDLRLVSVEHAPGIISRLIRVTNRSSGSWDGAFGVLETGDAIRFPRNNFQRRLSIPIIAFVTTRMPLSHRSSNFLIAIFISRDGMSLY